MCIRDSLTRQSDHVVFISAQNRENLEELRDTLYKLVKEKHYTIYPNWTFIPLGDEFEEDAAPLG